MKTLHTLFITSDNINVENIIENINTIGYDPYITRVEDNVLNQTLKENEFDIIFVEYYNDDFKLENTIERIRIYDKDVPVFVLVKSITVDEAFFLGNVGCNGYIKEKEELSHNIIEKELNVLKIKRLDTYNFDSLFTTLSSIADGVISTDAEGKITFINDAAQKITSWTKLEALDKPINEIIKLVNIKTDEKVNLPVKEVFENKKPRGLINNTALITKEGVKKLLSANISPIISGRNEIYGIVVVFRDITKFKRIEEELREEKNNLINTFKHMPVGMAILNDNHQIEEANTAFLKMLNHENVIGKCIGEVIYCGNSMNDGCGNSVECMDCELRRALINVIHNKQNSDLMKIVNSLDKTEQHFYKISIVPINISSKDKAILAIEDVTEDKILEENLMRSRDFYLSLFDNFPALILRTDISMKGDYFNENWVDFTGKSYDDQVGFGWLEAIHPEDNGFIEVFKNSFKKRIGIHIEHRLRRYDGIYRWVLSRATPYYDIDGSFGGYIFSSYDITDEKESAQKLKESEKKYKKLFMNMLNGFCYNKIIIGENNEVEDFVFIEVNEAFEKIIQLKKEQIVGKRFSKLLPDMMSSYNWIETFSKVALTGETISFEVNVFNDDSLWVNIIAYSTEKSYFAVLISDITEKKTVEIERQEAMKIATEAYKAKSEFLANMSHEIRTPLNGIIGMIDLTILTHLNEEQNDNLKTAKNCADSLLQIINDILDFSKLEAGKMKMIKKEFSIKRIIDKIIRIHKHKAKEKYLDLITNIQGNLPEYVIGDSNRLEQVLNNLVSNAVKFTDTGSITISTKVINQTANYVKIRFEVIDTGIGINEEDMNKLFVSFSQVDGSKTRTYGGTGLGLVISKQLIEIMGGSIHVKSKKNIGSNFNFEIKFELTSNEVRNNSVTEEIPLSEYKSNILLVEDDRVNQLVISKQLSEMGHKCFIANNGIEAIEIFNKRDFDLCLMDIQMPVLDGINTTIIIRKNQKVVEKYLPIIALTAHALIGDRERCLSIGMDEYLAKPFQINDLFNIIEKTLKKFKTMNIEKEILEICNSEQKINPKEQIKEIKRNIGLLEEFITSKKFQEIERVAHKIKEIAMAIKTNEIKTLAFRIELAARRKSIVDIIELKKEFVTTFINYIENITELST